MTEVGEGLGTPDFIAPEQIRDAQSADIRSDIYSLGCTLYFLLTGQPPFPDGTTYEKIAHHLEAAARPVNALRGGVPEVLCRIIDRMMAKDPEQRYQTPEEVAIDLENFLLGKAASLPTAPKRRRWPLGVACLLVGVSGLIGYHAYVTNHAETSTKPIQDKEAGGEVHRFIGHEGKVLAVAVAEDGQHVLSGSEDGTVRTWDLHTGEESRRVVLTQGAVGIKSLVFGTDPNRVAFFTPDGVVCLWSLEAGRELHRFENGGPLRAIALSPDAFKVLCLCHDNDVRLRDLKTGQELRRLRGHTKEATSVTFTADGRHFLSGGADGTVRLWTADTGEEKRVFRGHTGFVSSLAFSPDGRFALSGASRLFSARDRSVRLWEMASGRQLRCFEGHTGMVNSVAFSPDGGRVLSGAADRTVRLWDVASGQVLHVFEGHADPVASVVFSRDGNYALSGSWDKTIRLWRLPIQHETTRSEP